MTELGRGAIEVSYTGVCGGCQRRKPLNRIQTQTAAILALIAEGWGEDPSLGLLCPGCVRKTAEAMAKEAKRLREESESKIILTDAESGDDGETNH